MKKIFITLLLLLIITSCKKQEEVKIEFNDLMEIDVLTYEDDNPIEVGLYIDEYLVKEKTVKATNMQDIGVFNIYYTNEEVLENNNIKYNFNKYYNQYENISNYKIGFIISFEAEGKTYHKQIIIPDCEYTFAPYLYVYLYDDIHQPDYTWYSHLKEDEMTDETIFSSIKLFMADKGTSITSPITLTVFTYDEDDFDKDNNYIGKSYYQITINLT